MHCCWNLGLWLRWSLPPLTTFVYGQSLAAAAAGALVEMLGRREGGKTLGQQTVFAVLVTLTNYFRDGILSTRPLTVLALTFDRVATMAISDANKGLMLQFGELLDTLVKALLLDSPRRGEVGADAVQEASAGLLASLALFGPGAEALRGHDGVMRALRLLRDGVSSTEGSRESAVQALFQLEERKQVQAVFWCVGEACDDVVQLGSPAGDQADPRGTGAAWVQYVD